MTGSKKENRVFIPKLNLEPSDTTLPFKMKRKQFPIILSFAMTINKSQGQSFDHEGIYLREPVFSHGQLYVALSRCRNYQNIKVFIEQTSEQGKLTADENLIFTKNIIIQP